jgi:hypothetical protein
MKRREKYNVICMFVFLQTTNYSYQVLIRTEFSRQTSQAWPNVKFHDNPTSCSPVVPCAQKDGETTQLTAAFSNFTKTPNYEILIISRMMLNTEASPINSMRITWFTGIIHFEIRKCMYGFRDLAISCVMSNAKAIYHSMLPTCKTASYYHHWK